jgi:hypothetical protein
MGVKIDGNIRGHEGFTQVQASHRIIILHPMFWCIMTYSVRDPLPRHLYAKGLGFTRKIQVGYKLPDQESLSTCLFYKIYLLNIS